MSHQLELTIIIVNWNVRELLRACLLSLRRRLIADGAYEVHVVDNASSDGSVEMMRDEFPEVSLTVNRENVGFGRANNQIFGRCRGRFILLLNPDTEVLDDAVDRMLGVMRSRPDAGVVGCRLLNTDGSFQRAAGGAFPSLANVFFHGLFLDRIVPASWSPPRLWVDRDRGETFDIDWVSGAVMMLRPEALGDRIFDEKIFMFGEDMELCHRLRLARWRVFFTGEASVLHHHGASAQKQTSTEVLSLMFDGYRGCFVMFHGRYTIWIYDLILVAGYSIRWPCFQLLALFRPGRGFGARALESRRLALKAAGKLFGR